MRRNRKRGWLRVLVCGDWMWANEFSIRRELVAIRDRTELFICGRRRRGIDQSIVKIVEEMGLPYEQFGFIPEDFQKGGDPYKHRNRRALNETDPDVVLVFHTDVKRSAVVKDLVLLAKRRKLVVKIFNS